MTPRASFILALEEKQPPGRVPYLGLRRHKWILDVWRNEGNDPG